MQDELSIEKARVAILVEERNELLRKVFELEEQVRRLTPHALDGRDSAPSQAVSSPEVLSTLQAVSSPALPQVTQSVGRTRP